MVHTWTGKQKRTGKIEEHFQIKEKSIETWCYTLNKIINFKMY